jgi:sensor histidine kinase YesM
MLYPHTEDNGLFPTWQRLLTVFVGSTLVAALLWATKGRHGDSFPDIWVFSQCVGLSICFVHALADHFWRKRFGYAPAIIVGVLVGYPAGIFIAGQLGFSNAVSEIRQDGSALFRYAVAGVIFALAFTYYFYSRIRMLKLEQARREAELRETTGQKTALLAELRLLQAQIEPHFLFNTLANLHSLIGRDDALARQLLEKLNDYLRASLAHSRARQATLGDECAMLEAYLAIQQLRMGGRLQTNIEIDAKLRELAFPPMLLQPLVENAIIHGIEPKLGTGEVWIRAVYDKNMLRICIEDDGVGFGPSPSEHGIGISNVRERLGALFSGRARLEIKDRVPAGVAIDMWVPL